MTQLDECLAPALLLDYSKLLSQVESDRWSRFRFQRDRDRFLVSRALLRTILAAMVGDAPEALQFVTGPHGKPRLQQAMGWDHTLSFSLAHTEDLIVLGVTTDGALGLDVEQTDRVAPLDVGYKHFADVEIQALHGLAKQASQDALFWSFWTLKESLIKATGEGLHAPLNRFGFTFTPEHQITLHASPDTPEGACAWWFGQWAPTPHHLAAISLAWPVQAHGPGTHHMPSIRARKVIPLRGASDVRIQFLRSSTGLRIG